MAELTEAWWKKTKKDFAPKFPDTGMGTALKKYEAALAKLEEEQTDGNLKKALAALKLVKETLLVAQEACDQDEGKWGDFRGKINLNGTLKKEDAKLQKIKHDIVLEWKKSKAQNEDEAEYEVAWDEFEGMKEMLKTSPSLSLFTEISDHLDQLERLAEKCHDTPNLTKKYNIQLNIIRKERENLDDITITYKAAIKDCVDLRKQVLVDMKRASVSVTTFKGEIELLLEQLTVEVEKSDKDYVQISNLVHQITEVGQQAQNAFDVGTAPFAPSTTARNSLDIRAANIHTEDSTAYITDHFTALIHQNKANIGLIKEVQELVDLAKEMMPKRGRR